MRDASIDPCRRGNGRRAYSRRGARARRVLLPVLAGLLCLPPRGALDAQDRGEEQEPLPRLPAGVPVSFLPTQSVTPMLSGAWPGGATGRSDAVGRMNAELDFAISENRSTADWTSPGEAVRRVRRNPLAGVEPTRLAVGGLATLEPGKDQLYEPLHSQVRRLSALLGSRLVIVPVSIHFERDSSETVTETDPGEGAPGAGDSVTGLAPGHPVDVDAAPDGAPFRNDGRAVMTLAIVDTRSRSLLWYGEIEGPPTPADSPASLAALAAHVIEILSPS